MTEKQLVANRKNALKSTGPKTARGKANSAQNSLKHGILTAAALIPGIESAENWEKHLEGIFQSIAPVGYLEEMLTRRLAEISWRMSRVVRYEADCAAAAVATAETDLDERAEWGSGKPSDPAEAREEFERASEVREALETLSSAPNKQKINKYIAVAVEWALWSELPEGACPISVPGVPDEDEAFEAFDDWTVGLLRQEIEAYARAAQIAPEALRQKCISSASEQCNEAETKERNLVDRSRRWKLKLARETSNRMLLEPAVLSNVSRYESNLQRSFFKTLQEIQRLQQERSAAKGLLPATRDGEETQRQSSSECPKSHPESEAEQTGSINISESNDE